MTNQEWFECEDPKRMLEYLEANEHTHISDRKLRLFGLACCQRIAHLLIDLRTKNGLEVVERYADGLCSKEEIGALHKAARAAYWERREAEHEAEAEMIKAFPDMDPGEASVWCPSEYERAEDALMDLLEPAGSFCCEAIRSAVSSAADSLAEVPDATTNWDTRRAIECKYQCKLLREVIGNPFHPVHFDPTWLTPQAVALARTAYAERHFDDLPLLADALEEAGCTDEAILAHCRGPGPHVRGCWMVDLVLGKE